MIQISGDILHRRFPFKICFPLDTNGILLCYSLGKKR
jgi:hypothetical protein